MMSRAKTILIAALLTCAGGADALQAQDYSDPALEIGGAMIDYLITGQGSLIPGTPSAFRCHGLQYRDVSNGIIRQLREAIVFKYERQMEGELFIPKDVTVGVDRFHIVGFNDGALRNLNISAVNLPPDIRTIPNDCFYSCYNLAEVKFHGETTYLENNAFGLCHSLRTIHLPSSVKYIGDHCFDQSGLVEFVVPKSVEFLGSYAFSGCKSLRKITFTGHRLNDLQGYTFNGCESLEEVVLPPGLETIMSYAFLDSGLTRITVPASVSKIYSYAFNGTRLARIDLLAKNPPACGKLFTANDLARIELHVPRGTLAAYRSAPLWQKFVNIIDDL